MPIGRKPQGVAEKTQFLVPSGEPGVLVLGDVVTMATNGVIRADATDASKLPAVGVASVIHDDGVNSLVTVLTGGDFTFPNLAIAGGESFYLDPANPGKLTTTRPTKSDFPGLVGYRQFIAVGVSAPDKVLIQVSANPENVFPPSVAGTVIIQDEGGVVVAEANTLNFMGSGIAASASGANLATITSVDPTIIDRVTSEPIWQYDLVSTVEGSSQVQSASSDPTRSKLLGVAKESQHLNNETITVQIAGEIAINFDTAPAANENGNAVYVSGTAGKATLTAPSATGEVIIRVGYLSGADGIVINPTVSFEPQILIQL